MEKRRLRFLESAEKYLETLSSVEQTLVDSNTEEMRCGNEMRVKTKQLRGPIRELIVGNHRFTYFILETTIYFIRGFGKKSKKTPQGEIEYAEKIYKALR